MFFHPSAANVTLNIIREKGEGGCLSALGIKPEISQINDLQTKHVSDQSDVRYIDKDLIMKQTSKHLWHIHKE